MGGIDERDKRSVASLGNGGCRGTSSRSCRSDVHPEFKRGTVQANGIDLEYLEAGSGPLALLSSAIIRSTTFLSTDLRVPVASSPGDRLGASCLPVLADLLGLVTLSIRPRLSLETEDLFLRRQLALYK
jgi:hypothetical protein